MSPWCLQTPLCSASLVQLSPDYISHNLIIKQVLLVVIRNNKCVWLCLLMIVHELVCLFYKTDASAKQAAPAKDNNKDYIDQGCVSQKHHEPKWIIETICGSGSTIDLR